MISCRITSYNVCYTKLLRVDQETLLKVAERINALPKDLPFFKKVDRIISDRKMMLHDDRLDWAMGELLAYGTLVNEGHP